MISGQPKLSSAAAACLLALLTAGGAAEAAALDDLAELTLEQLATIEVTSVSGRPQTLRSAPASIYVITAEEIHRSAATSLPEALRLAPNLQVARLNAGQYAISARGFNNPIANKLLVLLDGRTIYSTLFAGVFWDFHDVPLDDVERIEVISGPGGAIWGANAVNGIINVVTRAAASTRGLRASVTRSHAGGEEVVRWGGAIGDARVRLYGMALDRDNTALASGVPRPDASSKRQAGFRADFERGADELTVQGDVFAGGELPATNFAPKMHGGNLLARWERRLADGSGWRLQASWDAYARDETTAFRNKAQTLDLQFTHDGAAADGHQLLWGGGYRAARDVNDPSPVAAFVPAARTLTWWNVFAQDRIALGRGLELTLGAKAERNRFTGVELLPTARVAYTHAGAPATSWAAVSRAVRAPSRIDRDFFFPGRPPYSIAGGPDFRSERATVIEAGHRGALGAVLSYDATVFRQRYTGLRAGAGGAVTTIQNRIRGHVDGLEAWATWQALPAWRLAAGTLQLRKSLRYAVDPPATAATGIANLGDDPRSQWKLRSQLDLPHHVSFDVTARRVGALPAPAVPAYTALDARLAWQPRPDLELSLLGHDLTDARHVEFNAPASASQLRRRLFVRLAWQL